MKSYKQNTWPTTKLVINKAKEGESIETKIERMVNNKEAIKNESPLIFTERKDGVLPGYDIRTDRWEVAVEASTAIAKSYNAKREERHKPKEEQKKDGGTEPIQGKPETDTNKAK